MARLGASRAPVTPPLVIKVGGSLFESGRLAATLTMLARALRPIVIVPGGGPFADKVREQQRQTGFDDQTAHRLAMLSMHRMAETFTSLEPQLIVIDRVADIAPQIAAGRTPVWVPLPTLDGDTSLQPSWDTTSDAIAARLAELLGHAPVVLLKSVDVMAGATADHLSAAGVIDRAFAGVVERSRLDWHVIGPSGMVQFEAFLTKPSTCSG